MKYNGLLPNIFNLSVNCVVSNTILFDKSNKKLRKILNDIDFSAIENHERFLSTRNIIYNVDVDKYQSFSITKIKEILDEGKTVVVHSLDKNSGTTPEFFCRVLDDNPKVEINSAYLLEIVQYLINGEALPDSVKYIKALHELARNSKDVVENPDFFKENWKFNDKKKPSQEEIENFKKVYDKFIEENNVKVISLNDTDKVLDIISRFYDNNDPFALLKFNENFDRSVLKDDFELAYQYDEALTHPKTTKIKELYGFWKPVIEKQYDLSNPKLNKYLIAVYYESVENTINTYEILKGVTLNKKNCIKILPDVITELYQTFNPFDFVEKYYVAQYHNHHKNFTNLFVSQYIKLYKPEPKLF